MPPGKLKNHLRLAARYLSSKPIYALNRVLAEICDELEITSNDAIITPFLFDKRRRGWRFACVLDHVWGVDDEGTPDKDKFMFEYALSLLKIAASEKLWLQLLRTNEISCFNQESRWSSEGYKWVLERVAMLRLWLQQNINLQKHDLKDQVSQFLDRDDVKELIASGSACKVAVPELVSELSSRRSAYAFLEPAQKIPVHAATELLLASMPDIKKADRLLYVAEMAMAFYSGLSIHRCLLLPGLLYRTLERAAATNHSAISHVIGDPTAGPLLTTLKLAAILEDGSRINAPEEDDQITTEVLGRTISDDDWNQDRCIELVLHTTYPFYTAEVQNQFKVNSGAKPVLLLPIRDVWLGSVGYGGMWACLSCTFESDNARAKFLEQSRSQQFIDACEILAAELYATSLVEIANVEIEPPYNLIGHFVKVLSTVQDWDRISVFRIVDGEDKLDYCYRRNNHAEISKHQTADQEWRRCDSTACSPSTVTHCANRECARRTIRWDLDKHRIWSREMIPELSDEEVGAYYNISLEFEFPVTASIPADRETREIFDTAVIQQQLEVLRVLVPKIRARRSALRNAAASIMARNMSHNIGSHVLAAARRSTGVTPVDMNLLSEHLQKRMDFIAELATTTSNTVSDAQLLGDVLGSTTTEVDGTDSQGGGLNAQNLICRHISGIEAKPREKGDGPNCSQEVADVASVPVACVLSVHRESEVNDYECAMPSGVLGWQALYVIIENLWRNIAKHTAFDERVRAQEKVKTPGRWLLKIDLHMKVARSVSDEMVELRLWDRYGTANKKVSFEVCGRRIEISPVSYLRDVLEHPRFLGPSNEVLPHAWGMKEILISAAFLRGVPVAELEGFLPSPPLVTVEAMDDEGECADPGASPEAQAAFKNIGYRLQLRRAKKLAVFVAEDDFRKKLAEAPERVKALADEGIAFIDLNERRPLEIWHRRGVVIGKAGCLTGRDSELPLDTLNLKDEDVGVNELSTLMDKLLDDITISDIMKIVDTAVLRRREKGSEQPSDLKLFVSSEVVDGFKVEHCDVAAEKNVFFDSHGKDIYKAAGHTGPMVFQWPAFYESIRSTFPQRAMFEALKANSDGMFERLVKNAAWTPVVILDERLQRLADDLPGETYEGAIYEAWTDCFNEAFRLRDIWRRMRVYVPKRDECSMEVPVADDICCYLESLEVHEKLRGVYLITHQTILERMGDTQVNFMKFVADRCKEKSWVAFVCSGRGMPWQLMERHQHIEGYAPRFISLSELLDCLERRPSKVHLIRSLEVKRAPNRHIH